MTWNIILDSPHLPFRKSPPTPLTLPSWVPVSWLIVVVVVSMEVSPSPFLVVLVTFLTFLIPPTPAAVAVAADILLLSALQMFQTETVPSGCRFLREPPVSPGPS